MDNSGVHRTHCCQEHGCKYSEDDTCPVVNGQVKQDYPCESCEDSNEAYSNMFALYALEDNISRDEIDGPYVEHPSKELVALFTSKKKAEDYVNTNRLKKPRPGWGCNYPFRRGSALSCANDYEIEELNHIPIDPE